MLGLFAAGVFTRAVPGWLAWFALGLGIAVLTPLRVPGLDAVPALDRGGQHRPDRAQQRPGVDPRRRRCGQPRSSLNRSASNHEVSEAESRVGAPFDETRQKGQGTEKPAPGKD
jgi:hypothetical protein